MKNYGTKILKTVLFLLPGVLAVIGFAVLESVPAKDALFRSIRLYGMEYEETPPNILLEIARWTAPLATLSGVVGLFYSLKLRFIRHLRYLRGNSVAVYGDQESRDILLRQLGHRGINGGSDFVQADSYILVGSEQENLDFLDHWRDQLADRPIYLKSETIRSQNLSIPHLRPFRREELAAQLFWEKRFLYPEFLDNGGRLEIILLGFDFLGDELLTVGLQQLIYAADQQICWHIFGDGEKFLALHPNLNQIGDKIVFYQEHWYRHLDLLERADLVVVDQQEQQIDLLEDLLSVLHRQEIEVFSQNADAAALINEDGRLRIFDWKRETQKIQYVLGEELLARAKRINLRYAHLYGGVEETPENQEAEWDRLNTFTRYSNISAADYHTVRLRMLAYRGLSPEQVLDDPVQMDKLAHLEHIRWCRYHYLHNWSYGVPENEKTKDPVRRIHIDLVPYEALTQEDREKDFENIRVLFSV